MTTYVQAEGSDTWHWCRNCHLYPKNIAKRRSDRPRTDLCNFCKGHEEKKACIT